MPDLTPKVLTIALSSKFYQSGQKAANKELLSNNFSLQNCVGARCNVSGEFAIKYWLLIFALFLSACSVVDVQDYVHAPTHELRNSVIYSGHQSVRGVGDQQFVLVPNFRTFTSSYSVNRALLIVVSAGETIINVRNVLLRNQETGAFEAMELNKTFEVAKPVPDTEYFLGFVPLFKEDYARYSEFNQAGKLELTIKYSIDGGQLTTETAVLERVVDKDVAWVT